MIYDAFISYSHAKDKPIAEALQTVIQRLGKPWYRRRVLRVFRDDTSLSATPHLWPNIEQALSDSHFLILLASPEAASSQWVNKEITYWLEHKSADTLLIGVTSGVLAWNNEVNDFEWGIGTPLPSALRTRFAAQPRWVDLTPYRSTADKRNATFADLAADFAAAVRGMPKEDLLSEELRQKRRALTLASSAAAAFLMLAVAATVTGLLAIRAEREANNQRVLAKQRQVEAEQQRDQALKTQSRFLADLARQQHEAWDAATATLLAIEALPDEAAGIARPLVPEAEFQLDSAFRALREKFILEVHAGAVLSVAFSPDGKFIVTASNDETARVWDVAMGQSIGKPLKGHQGAVTGAAFSPDGKRIVTASIDKTARLWDAATGQPLAIVLKGHMEGLWSAAFSPDGKRIVTASSDNTARLWDAATGQSTGKILRGHQGPVTSAVFSRDGKFIVTASMDRTARLWDAATGQPIGAPLKGHQEGVMKASFSPDGKRIVTASADATAWVWDTATGRSVGEPLRGHRGLVSSATFSPDGRRILTTSSDETARIWDAATGKPIHEPFAGKQGVAKEGPLWSGAFSPTGKTIVTASSNNTVHFWNAELDKVLEGHTDEVQVGLFSPDGRRIVTTGKDGTIRFWDADTGVLIGEPLQGNGNEVISAMFSPGGERILTSSAWEAQLWDAKDGKKIGKALKVGGSLTRIHIAGFGPDGSRIIIVAKGPFSSDPLQLWDGETGQPIGQPLKGPEEGVLSAVAFSSDRKRLATTSTDDTVRIWDTQTGMSVGDPFKPQKADEQRQQVGDGPPVLLAEGPNVVAFSPDGGRLLIGSLDGTAQLWDLATGKPIRKPFGAHAGVVSSVAFSHDGSRMVTASEDRTAQLWDGITGAPIGASLKGHQEAITCVAFSPDGKRIVTTSADKTSIIWDLFANAQEMVARAQAAVPRCLTEIQRTMSFLPTDPPDWCIKMQKWPYHTEDWANWLQFKLANAKPPVPTAPEWQQWIASHH